MRASPLVLVLAMACSDYRLNPNDDGPIPDTDTDVDTDADTDTEPPPPEECNGIDDDLDGEVDEGFDDLDADGIADCVDDDCDLDVPAAGVVDLEGGCEATWTVVSDPWDVRTEWRWDELSTDASIHSVFVAPVVGRLTDDDGDGDVDEDDPPDVAFVAFAGTRYDLGVLVVLDAATGAEQWTQAGWRANTSLSLADVDGDGRTDIVGVLTTGAYVTAVTGTDGTPIWSTNPVVGGRESSTVADLFGDGNPEVLVDELVFDALTGALVYEFDVDASVAIPAPTVADLDLDGEMEVLYGNACYAADGTLEWKTDFYGLLGQWSAVVQADTDPEGEVVIVGGRTLAVFDTDGTELTRVTISGSWNGPPCAADFDGDGTMEVAVPTDLGVSQYELDGTRNWLASTATETGYAGCSAFDLDGDGLAEVLYADMETFRILDGATGTELYANTGHESYTLYEFPVVADIDRDGAAEILVASSDYVTSSASTWTGVRALEHDGDGWASCGETWPTYDFSGANNVEPDGTIPTSPDPSWTTTGMFRGRPTEVVDLAPNLQVASLDTCWSGCETTNVVRVSVQVANTGTADVDGEVTVALYRRVGDTRELLRTATVTGPLAAGYGADAVVFELTHQDVGDGLVVVVDDDGTGQGAVDECDEDDNDADVPGGPC